MDRAAVSVLPTRDSVEHHKNAVADLRRRRDEAVAQLPDFEPLRRHAAAIKAHTLDHLFTYLEKFEARATRAGAFVHWAPDAAAHNQIVYRLLAARGARRVVKSKSMLTEECGLNAYLEGNGLEIVDTDLGERIVQLGGEAPSHIVVPAIHRTREEVGALFHKTLGSPAGESDPTVLTELARRDLRARFLAAEAGITGGNFLIAETGSLVVCTNEGNADLGMHLPPIHIACVGIEKLLPRMSDLPTFLRLLARSATGQAITAYTTVITGPRPDGELHIVLVDNGRSRLLGDPAHRNALACIRCGACLNTCPVYRCAGGHAYGQTVPGPIGSVLAPALRGDAAAWMLPFASSLCGSCSAVCPVGIDLHGQLLAWRAKARGPRRPVRLGRRLLAEVLVRPMLYRIAAALLRFFWPLLGRRWRGNPASSWLLGRELPPYPARSFRRRFRTSAGRGS
jgi:L-lactate dehydrogenase complex protein LldF